MINFFTALYQLRSLQKRARLAVLHLKIKLGETLVGDIAKHNGELINLTDQKESSI